jgi:hypothetical protein
MVYRLSEIQRDFPGLGAHEEIREATLFFSAFFTLKKLDIWIQVRKMRKTID